MKRIALFAAAAMVVMPSAALAETPRGNLLDQFKAGRAAEIFHDNPTLVRLSTVGSPEGKLYADLDAEVADTIAVFLSMVAKVEIEAGELIEVRVETRTQSDLQAVRHLIERDGRMTDLPVTYHLVERLEAARAHLGIDAIARSRAGIDAMTRLYGTNVAPS